MTERLAKKRGERSCEVVPVRGTHQKDHVTWETARESQDEWSGRVEKTPEKEKSWNWLQYQRTEQDKSSKQGSQS